MLSGTALSLRQRRLWGRGAHRIGVLGKRLAKCSNRYLKRLSELAARQWVRVAVDVVVLNAALALALGIGCLWALMHDADRLAGIGAQQWADRYVAMYLDMFWILTSVALLTFWISGFYTYALGYRIQHKVLLIAEAVTFAFVMTAMVVFLIGAAEVPSRELAMAWAIAIVLFVASRVWSQIWRKVLRSEGQRTETVGVLPARTMLVEAAGDGTSHEEPEGGEKTVLVIGGAGYIGSALLPKLLTEGYRLRVLDLFLYGVDPIAAVVDHPKVEFVRADFRQVGALVRATQGVDHVVHLGGIVGDPACAIDEELTIDINLAATRLVGEVAKGEGVKHFVFASSCSVYGASDEVLTEKSALHPLSLYAKSKLASEKVLLEMTDDTFGPTIVRFGTIYGLSGRTRFDLVVNLLAAKAAFDGRITVFGGDQWRPFLHVDDAAAAVAQLLHLPPGGVAEVFNVGSNLENYTIGQVGEIVKRVVPEAELTVEAGDRDRRNYRVNFSKIQIMAGFEPRWTVEKGVRQVVNAIRSGKISDYNEVRYSNEKYLTATNGDSLARPQSGWAHDLIREPTVSVTGVQHPPAIDPVGLLHVKAKREAHKAQEAPRA